MSFLKRLFVVLCAGALSAPMVGAAAEKPTRPPLTQVVLTMPAATSATPRTAVELDEDVRRYGAREASAKGLDKYEGGYWYYIVTPIGVVVIVLVVLLLLR